MRTTVELPDDTFQALKALAVQRGITLKEVLRRAAERELSQAASHGSDRTPLPLIPSKKPASLDLTNADIEDLLA